MVLAKVRAKVTVDSLQEVARLPIGCQYSNVCSRTHTRAQQSYITSSRHPCHHL